VLTIVQPVQRTSARYLGSVLIFTFLFFLFYILPEWLLFKQYGFAPVEHLVATGTHPSLARILSSLWTDRAHLLNPTNNPLVRFFVVTTLVGVVFDQVKKYAPSNRDRSSSASQ
jgi:hypothetical protein